MQQCLLVAEVLGLDALPAHLDPRFLAGRAAKRAAESLQGMGWVQGVFSVGFLPGHISSCGRLTVVGFCWLQLAAAGCTVSVEVGIQVLGRFRIFSLTSSNLAEKQLRPFAASAGADAN